MFTPNSVAATKTQHFSFNVNGNRCGAAATVSDTPSVITNPQQSVHYAIYDVDRSMENLDKITGLQKSTNRNTELRKMNT